jgi:pilus assembly protein CpaC
LGATIAALQSHNLLQILSGANVLAINGHNASFLAGGEFPFPNLQGGGAALGAVTIQFREFGVRINSHPDDYAPGTIRLTVTSGSQLTDFANGLIFSGFTIPALSTRRVATEIELEEGQTFAIGGLLITGHGKLHPRPGMRHSVFRKTIPFATAHQEQF